jgi:hypothetical protein
MNSAAEELHHLELRCVASMEYDGLQPMDITLNTQRLDQPWEV